MAAVFWIVHLSPSWVARLLSLLWWRGRRQGEVAHWELMMGKDDSRNFETLAARCACTGLVASLALLWACARPARTAGDPEAEFRARLGQEWALVRLGSVEVPHPAPGTPADTPGKDLVPGRRPTIRFTPDPTGAGGRSFCNGYGGPYVVRGDSLRIERIESTAVGCDGPDSLETRFFRALRDTRRFELDSVALILITVDGTRLTFVPSAADSGHTRP